MHIPRRPVWQEREGLSLAWFVVAVITVLSALPLGRLALTALAPAGSLDVGPLIGLLASDEVFRATGHTLWVGAASAVLAVSLGMMLALLFAVTDVPGKLILAFVFVLSLMIAPQVAALSFKTLAGPASPLLNAVGLAPAPGHPNPLIGPSGIILVMGLHHAPLAAITIAPGLSAFPRVLVEMAALDGATPLRIVRHVLLPLLRPHVVAACLITFVAGMGNFGIPALLGLPVGYLTLPTLVYQKIASFGPALLTEAAGVSLLIAALSMVGVVAAILALPTDPSRLEADHVMRPFCRLGWWRWPVAIAAGGFMAVTVILPLASLLATSMVPAYGVRLSLESFTLGRFAEVLLAQDVTLRAFRNSLLLAGAAALILAVLAVLVAYVTERRLARWRTPLLVVSEMPYALPGLVLAIGCILLFVRPLPLIGVSLYATPWIILFAYLARFLPVALKPTIAAMSTLAPDQEEAAVVFGANLRQRLYYIVFPRVAAAAAAGALLVFLVAFNELTVSALLWSAGTETLGVVLLSFEDAGLGAEAAAVGVVAVVVVLLIMMLLDRLVDHLPDNVLPWRALARR